MSWSVIIGFGMLMAPVLWCLGQLFIPLFKTFDRKGWLIFGGILAWYATAIFFLNWVQP